MTRAQMARAHVHAREQWAECFANGHWQLANFWADQAFTWANRAATCA